MAKAEVSKKESKGKGKSYSFTPDAVKKAAVDGKFPVGAVAKAVGVPYREMYYFLRHWDEVEQADKGVFTYKGK